MLLKCLDHWGIFDANGDVDEVEAGVYSHPLGGGEIFTVDNNCIPLAKHGELPPRGVMYGVPRYV